MAKKSITLRFSRYQMDSFKVLFEESDILTRTDLNISELVAQAVLLKLYKKKFLLKLSFPEEECKMRLELEESAALLWALQSTRYIQGSYHTLTLQEYTNQLHQHHA